MEAKNIRWGELVGGMLIVICSCALVVSFWSQIAQTPVLKFFLFTGVTAVLFGMGLYTEYRWKLPTTSRGLLIISTLLVPLNFLAIAAFSEGPSARQLMLIVGEFVAIGLFALLAFLAGRVVTRPWPAATALAVVGASAMQLLLRRFAGSDMSQPQLLALGAMPLACTLVGSTVVVYRAWTWKALGRTKANTIFSFLGLSAFAAVVSLGLLLFKSGAVGKAMHQMAPLMPLLGAAPLVSGLIFWRRMTAPRLAALRTAGTAVAAASALVMLVGVVLAWPDAATLLPVTLLNFAIFSIAAIALRMPWAHLPAGVCLALGYLVTVHVVGDRLEWHDSSRNMIAALISAASGVALVPLAGAFGLAAALLPRWRNRTLDGRIAVCLSGTAAAVSLLLVTHYGFGLSDDHGATWVYLVYAAAASVIAWKTSARSLSWAAGVLLLMAVVQGFAYQIAPPWRLRALWQVATLIHAALMSGIAIVALRTAPDRRSLFVGPAQTLGLVTSIASAVLLVLDLSLDHALMLSWRTLGLAGVWLMMLWLRAGPRPALFTAFQSAITLAALLLITARLNVHDWFVGSFRILHPWSLQAYITAVALLSAMWIGLRRMSRSEMIRVPGPCLDHLLSGAALIGLAMLVTLGILPGVQEELAVGSFARGGVGESATVWTSQALGPGSWCAVVTLLLVYVAGFWERFNLFRLLGVLTLAVTGSVLVAGQWHEWGAAASALRWCFSACLLGASLPIWWRDRLARRGALPRWPGFGEIPSNATAQVRGALLFMALLPVILLSLYAMGAPFGFGPNAPGAESFFGRIGPIANHMVPLALAAVVLAGHALRERSADFAFGAGLIVNLAATLAWGMGIVNAGSLVGGVDLVRLAQINAATAAVYALAWFAIRAWWVGGPTPWLLIVHVAAGVVINVLLIVPSTVWIIADPGDFTAEVAAAGDVLGWVAWILSAIAFGVAAIGASRRLSVEAIAFVAVMSGAMVCLSLCDVGSTEWVAYHALLVSQAVAAWLVFGLARRQHLDVANPETMRASAWPLAIGGFVVLLAVRACFGDPGAPWWSVGSIVAMAALCGAIAIWQRHGALLYAGGLLFNVAASIWWVTEQWQSHSYVNPGGWFDLLHVNLLAAVAAGVMSFWLKLAAGRRQLVWRAWPTLHHMAAQTSCILLGLATACGLWSDVSGESLVIAQRLPWIVLALTALLLIACLRDGAPSYGLPMLFVMGLVAIGIGLDTADLSVTWLCWNGGVHMAFYMLMVASLWRWRRHWLAVFHRAGWPEHDEPVTPWLVQALLAVGAVATLLAFYVVLTFTPQMLERTETAAMLARIAAAAALFAGCASLGLLQDGDHDRSWLRQTALLWSAVALVAVCWAIMTPTAGGEQVLARAVIVLVVAALAVANNGVVLGRLLAPESNWGRDAARTVRWLVGLGAAALLFVLAAEVFYTVIHSDQDIPVPMSLASRAAVIVALIGSIVMLVIFAVVPGRDPLRLSEKGRTAYIYVTEALMAATFMHVRLSMPWLFHGFFRQYWPLIVMLIAFVGVGLSELFRRQNSTVLAKPLQNTGAFLPLLPVLGFWTLQSNVDYSGLLLTVGLLYGVLAVMRRAFGFGILAALAANGSLWVFLHDTEHLKLWQHPQLWLIPPSLCVLAAAQLNRDRLNTEQMTTVRYICLLLVYVSSTVDIFITGVADSPWLPLILAVLSVAGVMVGIMLRIQSFLFVGTSFLMLALVTMVWHASAMYEMTWLWYVAGICLGSAIIAIFAVFERKRAQMLGLLDNLRQWRG